MDINQLLAAPRHDWTREDVENLYTLPFSDLVFYAQYVHRLNFNPNTVQTCTLQSIKTGACPEDCKFCAQSGHFKETGIEKNIKNMKVETVINAAQKAKDAGATRFCMAAAWRHLFDKDVDYICQLIGEIKALGLESCMSLGMLTAEQAQKLKAAGLDYYNHNLETSEEYYKEIVSTHTYQDRLDTVSHAHKAGLKTCCGGLIGMGESRKDRIGLLNQLATQPVHPKSVPINLLITVSGTPLENQEQFDHIEFIRTIATARLLMPASFVRLSAGRTAMTDEMQALCFLAGANSIFLGDTLLTQPNPGSSKDDRLFSRLGIQPMDAAELTEYA